MQPRSLSRSLRSSPVVIGVQRLALGREPERSSVLAGAIDAGVTWVDTADAYGTETGDAERWLAAFVGRVHIATKGGLKRTDRRWLPDGRTRSLLAAAEASRQRLGVDQIDLYFLHAPDPRTPWLTTVRALAQLHRQGVAAHIGLCNVSATQLRQAQEHLPIACVQMELSPFATDAVHGGVVETAQRAGIPIWAYRPLGGERGVRRVQRHADLAAVAAALGVSPEEVALAWLSSLGVTPLAGPTRPQTVRRTLNAAGLSLTTEQRERLDRCFPWNVQIKVPRDRRAPPPDADGDVVIVMGSPGAGKTTRVQARVDAGYARLNRDDLGGTLRKLVPRLDALLQAGQRRVVLDNTYPKRASRNAVLETAWRHGVPVRCEWLQTSDDDCEQNVIHRVLDTLGYLPEPDAFDKLNRRAPGVLAPRALHGFRAQLEPPLLEEGFVELITVPFARHPASGQPALFIDPRHLQEGRPELQQAAADHTLVAVVGWQPNADRAELERQLTDQAEALGLRAVAAVCPHPGGPPRCWCRKPLAGLGVWLARQHGIDLAQSSVLATTPTDRTFARKLGAGLVST